MNNFAHLREESPFYTVFPPSGLAPIHNILVPTAASLEGVGVQECYMLDLARVSQEQKMLIAAIIAKTRGGSFSECLEWMSTAREMPIRMEHILGVSTDSLAFL